MKRAIPLLLVQACLLAAVDAAARGPSGFDARAMLPVVAARPELSPSLRIAAGLGGRVTSVDERTGRPTMLTALGGAAGLVPRRALAGVAPATAASRHLGRFAAAYAVDPAALGAARAIRVHDTGRGGVIVTIRSFHGGVEVFEHDTKVLLDRANDLVAISGAPHPAARAEAMAADTFLVGAEEAVETALRDLADTMVEGAVIEVEPTGREDHGGFQHFARIGHPSGRDAVVLPTPGRAKRVFFPMGDELVPAFVVEAHVGLRTSTSAHLFRYVIAANDGQILQRRDLSAHVDYRVSVDADGRPTDGPHEDFTPHPTGVPDGSYPAFVAPILTTQNGFNSPGGGAPDPWLPLPGAPSVDVTQGNNVDAYTDHQAPDGFTEGDLRAAVTDVDTFDHAHDPDQEPLSSTEQTSASIVQAFYVANWLHDYYYDSGFDEIAGNAQFSNHGRGGAEGDPLHVEVQDSALGDSTTEGAPPLFNNANMSTPGDGVSPRMQLYLFFGGETTSLLAEPGGLSFPSSGSEAGPQDYDITAPIIAARDGGGAQTDGCELPWNDVSGAVALVDRGGCLFDVKAANAVASGAVALVVANTVAGAGTYRMTGTGDTLPAMMVSFESGAELRAALEAGPLSVQMTRQDQPARDAALDNLLVAHEWGHYLHFRLSSGATAAYAATSEGWADFLAFHMSLREGEDRDGTFGYSTHVAFPDAYFGRRRFPYSRDPAANALSFRHIANGEALPSVPMNSFYSNFGPNPNAEVHNAGEVWASMLFDGYHALLDRAEGASAPYDFDEARRRMADYAVAGIQMAPFSATFTEARDGLLSAAWAADASDAMALAGAFAQRGAGTCAISPDRTSETFTGVVESFTLAPVVGLGPSTADDATEPCEPDGLLDAGERGVLTIEVQNGGFASLADATVEVSAVTPGVSFPAGSSVAVPAVASHEATTLELEVALDDTVEGAAFIDVLVEVTSASACEPTVTALRSFEVNLGAPGDCPDSTSSGSGGAGGDGGETGGGGAGATTASNVAASSGVGQSVGGGEGGGAMGDAEAGGDGCGCRLVGEERSAPWPLAAVGLGLALARVRMRRGRRGQRTASRSTA